MQLYISLDHEVNNVSFPGIPGVRVQSQLSGRVKPNKVTSGDILLEYVRDIFGF